MSLEDRRTLKNRRKRRVSNLERKFLDFERSMHGMSNLALKRGLNAYYLKAVFMDPLFDCYPLPGSVSAGRPNLYMVTGLSRQV
jgi:hypothetical protein